MKRFLALLLAIFALFSLVACNGDGEGTGGTSVSYEAMEGKGHSIWDAVVTKEGLFDWLFAQRKS